MSIGSPTRSSAPAPAERITFRSAVAELRAHQKPGYGVPAYLRWVNRGLGRTAAALGAVVGMSPSAMTLLSGLVSAAGLAVLVLAPMSWWTSGGAAALLLLGYALDSADGQLARLTGRSSVAGEWLDHVVDAVRLPAVHLAIAVATLRIAAPAWLPAVALAFAALASAWFFAQTLAEKLGVAAPARPTEAPAWLSFVKLPYDTGFLYLLVPLLALPLAFTVAYTALFLFTAGVAVLSMRRKYRALAGGA